MAITSINVVIPILLYNSNSSSIVVVEEDMMMMMIRETFAGKAILIKCCQIRTS
jgi:hypothetical protein